MGSGLNEGLYGSSMYICTLLGFGVKCVNESVVAYLEYRPHTSSKFPGKIRFTAVSRS